MQVATKRAACHLLLFLCRVTRTSVARAQVGRGGGAAHSRIARIMTRLTGMVALVGSLPVDVLIKSAPAAMHLGPRPRAWLRDVHVGKANIPAQARRAARPR